QLPSFPLYFRRYANPLLAMADDPRNHPRSDTAKEPMNAWGWSRTPCFGCCSGTNTLEAQDTSGPATAGSTRKSLGERSWPHEPDLGKADLCWRLGNFPVSPADGVRECFNKSQWRKKQPSSIRQRRPG